MTKGQHFKSRFKEIKEVKCGDQQFEKYLPLLRSKRVAVITNVTGLIARNTNTAARVMPPEPISIVDTLLKLKINIKKIFGPEHGFRSDIDAGEKVTSNVDKQTGLTVISLYGSNKKPTKEQLADVDVVIYDIQDVGVRFYTYISTMCYAMEACAENKKEFIVLDRPNPNGFYIDGPVMRDSLKSFLGLHPVPLIYGMTCGEYAKMVNGEGWLKNKVRCKLTVIPLKNYDRKSSYILPRNPSPNIPNQIAVILYPTLGLFEGTMMSLGRGTPFPFQVVGHPDYPQRTFSFTPRETPLSKNPKYLNDTCYGLDLRESKINEIDKIDLDLIKKVVTDMNKENFFDKNFNFHAGNAILQEQLRSKSVEEIRKSWEPDIQKFKTVRKKYLLYPDF